MGYLTNFIVYMLAMVGVLVVAMLVFKHSTCGVGKGGSGKCLKVLDTLSLGARKTLYIVSAGEEKFLIAGDTDRTTLISKLNPRTDCAERISAVITNDENSFSTNSYENSRHTSGIEKKFMDRSILNQCVNQGTKYNSVMRNLAEKIQVVSNE